jgi:hypothetical protein
MASKDVLSGALFHWTTAEPDEFMRAPSIHVGDIHAAVNRSTVGSGSQGAGYIYALSPEHVVTDPEVFRDQEANWADITFLKDRNLVGSSSLSVATNKDGSPVHGNVERHDRAAEALSNNRSIDYENAWEKGISKILVSPQFNTHLLNGGMPLTEDQIRDLVGTDDQSQTSNISAEPRYGPVNPAFTTPKQQQVLPLDYSRVNPSERTKSHWRRQEDQRRRQEAMESRKIEEKSGWW